LRKKIKIMTAPLLGATASALAVSAPANAAPRHQHHQGHHKGYVLAPYHGTAYRNYWYGPGYYYGPSVSDRAYWGKPFYGRQYWGR